MKILYNKNGEKMKAVIGFEPAHTGKLLLAATLPTELFMLATNSFQNHT